MLAYESALRANPQSVPAMMAIALILRTREEYHKAIEYLQAVIKLEPTNGDAFGNLGKRMALHAKHMNRRLTASSGHCYLMIEDLRNAYESYQNAITNLQNPKVRSVGCAELRVVANTDRMQEPKLWYGIGILYDRWGSLEHAEEAFSQVMQMQPDFEKANEIYFRLGIIYKQQQKYGQSLEVSRSRGHEMSQDL